MGLRLVYSSYPDSRFQPQWKLTEGLEDTCTYLSVEAVGWVVVVQDGLALTSDLSMKAGLLEEGRILRAEVILVVLCVCVCVCVCVYMCVGMCV